MSLKCKTLELNMVWWEVWEIIIYSKYVIGVKAKFDYVSSFKSHAFKLIDFSAQINKMCLLENIVLLRFT